MIIVPNVCWQTFRYWAIRATDMHGMGSSPGRETFIVCTDFNLSNKTYNITNNSKLLPFIYISGRGVSLRDRVHAV
jgi:hypothetical protein